MLTIHSFLASIVLSGGLLFSGAAHAKWDLECYIKNNCRKNSGSPSSNPSTSSQVRINPSAVPTEAGLGIEGMFYKSEVDVAVVRGTGRVGAAISPSNSEETFFGPPGFELEKKFYERKLYADKFPNQKITLAGAVSLLSKYGSGLKSYSLKLGAMGKYNKFSKVVSPGVGLNGVVGPITFGGSIYEDETIIKNPLDPEGVPQDHLKYMVQTYNVGLFLNSVILDYSRLQLLTKDTTEVINVTLLTASLMLKNFILTAAHRSEISPRASFNYESQTLERLPIPKEEIFAGVQYSLNKNFMLGVFYNYYLLREGSVSATLFF